MVISAILSKGVILGLSGLFGGAPKIPSPQAPPLQADADAIAKAKNAKLMQAMAASGRESTISGAGSSDKLGG